MLVLDPAAPAALPAAALTALHADPVRHTTALSLLDAARRDPVGSPLQDLLVLDAADGPQVLLRTPTRPLVATALTPAGVDEVAAHLSTHPSPGVTAEAEVAEALLGATGLLAQGRTDLRLFRLGTLVPPVGVVGRARPVDGDDPAARTRVGAALDRVAAEAATHLSDGSGAAFVGALAARGHALLEWWVDGEPVALACTRAPVAGAARTGPVWTDPGRRGHGHGAAVTAAAAGHALARGAVEVCLYTDLANPVSNRVYPRVGFVAVRDHRELAWGSAGSGPAGP